MKKFAYLVQSEGGLRRDLQALHGHESDVFLLTWRKPTKNGIFFPSSTWTEGRNRLYQQIVKTNYIYYIFLDGDIELHASSHTNVRGNPWRLFEKLLMQFLPAVGVPRFSWHKQTPERVKTVYYFDAPLNAIHREALHVLLPFYDGDDRESWWNSGIYYLHLASMLYRNHVLQFNTIEATDTTHGFYPKHFDWERVDERFKACILRSRLKGNFQSHHPLSVSSNGSVRMKKRRYGYTDEELSQFFDTTHQIFKRRAIIRKNIITGKPYAVCARSKLPYWGEYVQKQWGSTITMIVFSPLVVANEGWKTYGWYYRKTRENAYRIFWYFLKLTQPIRHQLRQRKRMHDAQERERIHKIITHYNDKRDTFFFIQIGANDGFTGDPIHVYIQRYRWKGILVEPVSSLFRRLKHTYRNISGLIFENVAIRDEDGYRTFYRIEENAEPDNPIWYDQLGTFHRNVIEKHRDEIPNFDKHFLRERVRCISLNTLLKKHNVSTIDLLFIDAEGDDYEIIKHIPFGAIEPAMIWYEHQHLRRFDRTQCAELLSSHGYRLRKTEEDTFAYKYDADAR